jgi:hypothetical protein
MKLKTLHKNNQLSFANTNVEKYTWHFTLRGNLAFGGHISTRTVIRRLHHHGMRARRPIKRSQLTIRHRHARMVNPEVVCHPSMAKATVMHANSLPPFWYG